MQSIATQMYEYLNLSLIGHNESVCGPLPKNSPNHIITQAELQKIKPYCIAFARRVGAECEPDDYQAVCNLTVNETHFNAHYLDIEILGKPELLRTMHIRLQEELNRYCSHTQFKPQYRDYDETEGLYF